MNRTIKPIASLVMAMMLILGTTFTASATASIVYEGGAEKYVFLPGSVYTNTDLFNNFKDVMPGDILRQEIEVRNDSANSGHVKIYMRAITHDENENPLTYNDSAETVATMQDFLAQLSMKIWNRNELIYEASPDELDGLENNVLLGDFDFGESTELTVELIVPMELGNEYANRIGEVDWIFTAEELNDTVKTGDSANIPLFLALLLLSIGMVAAVVFHKNRSKKKN